jgi:hypothetical protein
MKKLLLISALLLITFTLGDVFASNITSKSGWKLKKMLGDSISIKRNQNKHVVEYCPDNTCEVFSAAERDSSSIQKLTNFAYIYLYYVSDYIYLEDFRDKGNVYINNIVDINAEGCPIEKEADKIKCTIRKLFSKNGIEIKFIRYDEMQRSEVSVNLEAELEQLTDEQLLFFYL